MPILIGISPNLLSDVFHILCCLVYLLWMLVSRLNAALKCYSDEQTYLGGTEIQFDFYLMTCMWTSNFSPIIEVIYLTGRKVLRASSDDIHCQNAVVCNSVDFWICFPLALYSLYFFMPSEFLLQISFVYF